MPTRNNKESVRESTNIVNPFIIKEVVPNKTKKVTKKQPVRAPELKENYRVSDRIKESKGDVAELRNEEAQKYTIPYIPEKEIRLTTCRYNTGKISTNILDSIYNAAIRTGVPVDIALGLAGRESTLGIGRGFKRGQSVTGTDLMSNWQQIDPYTIKNSVIKGYNDVAKKYNNNAPLTKEEADKMIKFFEENDKAISYLRTMNENPIDNALKYYMAGKYNPGDKRHTQMVEEDAKVLMSDPAIQKWYQSKINTQMKCGGRRKAQLGLDIREGGIAIPIAPNMYYMDGRSHDEGGIAIGPNNKNGLEVEGGEVVKVGKNDVKVFSSVPLLRGASPAELVMGGANPNKVFKAQEDFKDRNRINDDGTTYEIGGEKTIHIDDLPSSFRGQIRNGRYVQIGVPPVTSKAKSWNTTFKDHVNSLNVELKDFIMDGINYGKKLLPKPLKKYYSRAINILNSPGVQDINNTAQKITQVTSMFDEKKAGGIYIKPNKRGTFTAAATKHGMGVQEFASKVLANKEDYSPVMVKKANFARNASRWKKELGGSMIYTINGNVKNGLSLRPKAELGTEKKYKHNKVDGYGDSVEIDGKFYRYDSDSGLYLLEDKETVNTNLPKTVYGASSVRHIAYDRQGNRYQRRSDGTLIRVSPKKDEYATSKELEEVVITPEKPKKVENVSITGEKVENGVKKTSTPSIEGKTSVSDYRTGPNAHAIPDFVGDEPVKVEESKPVTTNKATVDNKKVKTTKPVSTTVEQPAVVRRDEYYSSPRVEGLATPVDEAYAARQARGTQAVAEHKTDTNNDTEGKWIGQYKTTNVGDWIGLGSNLLGSILSYGLTSSAINKTPMPARPAVMQAAKLKTTYNVEPQLSEIREAEQMNRAAVRRNTASSNTSLAREQRLLNEARDARDTLYGQKENIETQLINQDRLNRQQVGAQNTALYNDYLNRVVGTKQAQNQYRISNVNNLLSGLTGSVNNILGTIESRRATNNTLRAIAAANPNVDARLIGGFDTYEEYMPDGTVNIYNKKRRYLRTENR